MFKLAGQEGGRLQTDLTRSVNWFHLALRKFYFLEFFVGTRLMGSSAALGLLSLFLGVLCWDKTDGV